MSRSGWPLAAFALLLSFVEARTAPAISAALLAVHRPKDLEGNHLGYFATFSDAGALTKGDLVVAAPEDELGCEEYSVAPGAVSVVFRGTCTFVHKAKMARKAGAAGVLIAATNETVQIMSGDDGLIVDEVFAVSIDHRLGAKLRNATKLAAASQEPGPVMAVSVYSPSLMNISELFLIIFATILVALGAFFSTADVVEVHPTGSFSTALAPQQEEVLEVDASMAMSFCAVGSGFLVFLFFFMRYMIYVIIFGFCCGGASCIAQFGAITLTYYIPSMKNKAFDVPVVGRVMLAEVITGVPALIIVVSWACLRNSPYGWPFQDLIGAGFLCWLQRTLRLPNIKIASILLTSMFFFDVFWVFISPLIFEESVMIGVARGRGTGETVPMLLKIPSFGDPFGSDRMLGFGDVALPGLLVSYLRRHDLMSRRTLWQGYFVPALIGYFVGLCVTIAALIVMRMGQPALLYLVPGTLGTTLVLALRHGEVSLLWEGTPAANDQLYEKDGLAADNPL